MDVSTQDLAKLVAEIEELGLTVDGAITRLNASCLSCKSFRGNSNLCEMMAWPVWKIQYCSEYEERYEERRKKRKS